MADSSRIKELLRKLRAVSVKNGAIAAEALAAAQKAREIADRHGIEIAELDAPEIAEAEVGLGRVQTRPIDLLWGAVAAFCHCTHIFGFRPARQGVERTIRYLGQPHEMAMAAWLHTVLLRHVLASLETFKGTRSYKQRKPANRRAAAAAFVEEAAKWLAYRLRNMTDWCVARPKIAAAVADCRRRYPNQQSMASARDNKRIRNTDSARKAAARAAFALDINRPIAASSADTAPLLISQGD